jgi:hypothetical protein
MTNRLSEDSKIITQALFDCKKAPLDMEISGLHLEEAIAALEKDIREQCKHYIEQRVN